MAVFDCATWRPISANTGGALRPIGLVLHHAVMNGSLHSFFSSPTAEVSAHFWVSQSGVIEQYVDSERVAWHGRDLNGAYCGVETEGCVAPPHDEPMSDAMVAALADLYGEGHDRHGWPNALAEANGQPGFGYHRMEVATACPCDVRLARRADILALAFGSPTNPPAEDDDMSAEDVEAIKADNDAQSTLIIHGDGRDVGPDRNTHPDNLRFIRTDVLTVQDQCELIVYGDGRAASDEGRNTHPFNLYQMNQKLDRILEMLEGP